MVTWTLKCKYRSERNVPFFCSQEVKKCAFDCDPVKCQSKCIAGGANDGICQLERNGKLQCVCSHNPVTPGCDGDTCLKNCIASGGTGGLCEVEPNGDVQCMCFLNPWINSISSFKSFNQFMKFLHLQAVTIPLIWMLPSTFWMIRIRVESLLKLL